MNEYDEILDALRMIEEKIGTAQGLILSHPDFLDEYHLQERLNGIAHYYHQFLMSMQDGYIEYLHSDEGKHP